MATYSVTTSNYNSSAFWSSISQSTSGHTLDFSTLPSNWQVQYDPVLERLNIWNGSNWSSIGEPGDSGATHTFGGATQLRYFTTFVGGAGNDYSEGSIGNDSIVGNAGADTLSGGVGADTASGGAGNDNVTGGSGQDSLLGGTG